jgi:Tfp pilus assembly protein PilE
MRKHFWKGLRTIDLLIILSIICIVVVIVAGRYDHFKCRAMQSEAKFSLQEIYAAQKSYHAKHNQYADIDVLLRQDKRVVLPQKYYKFKDLKEPTKSSFSVAAVGVNGVLVAGEQWVINQDEKIELTKAVCSKQ